MRPDQIKPNTLIAHIITKKRFRITEYEGLTPNTKWITDTNSYKGKYLISVDYLIKHYIVIEDIDKCL